MKVELLHTIGLTCIAVSSTYALGVTSCGRCSPETVSTPTTSATTSSAGTVGTKIGGEPEAGLPQTLEEYTRSWDPLGGEDLEKILGHWDSGDEASRWAVIEARSALDGGTWAIPYPWRVTFLIPSESEEPYDCGFFPDAEPGGWLLGYCMGGTVGPTRRAHKLTFRYKGDDLEMLYISLDDIIRFTLDRPRSARRPE